jgi:hypothetical protein
MQGRISRIFDRIRRRPSAYNWFLIKRKWGQRWLDPKYLRKQWQAVRTWEGLRPKLHPGWAQTGGDNPLIRLCVELVHHANWACFVGSDDRVVFAERYAREFPEAAQSIIQEADDLLAGKFAYAGEMIQSEVPPAWYANREIPGMGKWHRIPAAFHWLKTFGKAYWLTSDPTYAQNATRWLQNWLDTQHSFGHDIWRSTNFVGLRGMNMLQGLIFFEEVWRDKPELLNQLLGQLWLHAHLVERRMEYWGHNHLIWNAHDLALLGLALEPVFSDAHQWKNTGLGVLTLEVSKQFYPDGVNVELSVHYQVFVTKLIGEVIAAFWKAGHPLPPEMVRRWTQAVEATALLQRPDKKLPLYGDGYRTADPNVEGTIDELVPFLIGLRNHLQANPQTQLHALLPWCTGSDYWRPEPDTSSRVNASQSGVGIVQMREVNSDHALSLLFMAGCFPFGQVHAHADSLSFELADERGPVLIDPGAYGEIGDKWRQYVRSTRAHNTIAVDRTGISQVGGVYSLHPDLKAELTGHWQWDEWIALTARHTSFMRLPGKVIHHRTLITCGAKFLLVLDYLKGRKLFHIERFFHFAQGTLEQAQGYWRWIGNEREWRLTSASSVPLQEQSMSGSESPMFGWSGEYRGICKPIPSLIQLGSGSQEYLLCSAFTRPEIQVEITLSGGHTQTEGQMIYVPGGIMMLQKVDENRWRAVVRRQEQDALRW